MAMPDAGAAIKRARGSIRHRMGLARHFKATGQMPATTYTGQSGAHSFPAKVLDDDTRALIDAALAARETNGSAS
ncbi:hypothetical protein V5F44_19400 [Xanthobacter sp. V2C-8]|uniref:hypothetical protein n=1 Tax=Xanthobacter albus TaxID=3119929 RepID=UPI003729DA4B